MSVPHHRVGGRVALVLPVLLLLAACGSTADQPAGDADRSSPGVSAGGDEGGPPSGATDPPEATGSTGPTRAALPTRSAAAARSLQAELDALTSYDASAPLEARVETATVTTAREVRVTEVRWPSPAGGEVPAWLVEPPASATGPYAGIVYLHGSITDMDDFRDEAQAMATVGAVSLVVGAPFARDSSSVCRCQESYDDPALERAMNAQAVVDLRRAVDLLVARPDVDPARVGLVGHSWGAWIGLDAAAVDGRFAAVAMLSPRPSWTGFLATSDAGWVASARRLTGEEGWAAYLAALAPFDAAAQVGRVDGDALLLQIGDADDVVPPDVAQQLVDVAPPSMTSQHFPAGHALDDAATTARFDWFADRLALAGVAPDVLAEVGLPDE